MSSSWSMGLIIISLTDRHTAESWIDRLDKHYRFCYSILSRLSNGENHHHRNHRSFIKWLMSHMRLFVGKTVPLLWIIACRVISVGLSFLCIPPRVTSRCLRRRRLTVTSLVFRPRIISDIELALFGARATTPLIRVCLAIMYIW